MANAFTSIKQHICNWHVLMVERIRIIKNSLPCEILRVIVPKAGEIT